MRKTAATLLGTVILFCCAGIAGAADKYPPGPGGTCPDSVTIFRIQNASAACHPARLDTVLGVGGIITGFDAVASAYGFYLQNRGINAWAGIDIFTGATNWKSAPFNLALGDSVVVYGTVQEFQTTDGETEVEGPDATQGTNDIVIRKVSSGNALPAFISGTTATFHHTPTALSPAVAAQEQYEGMLVKVTNVPLIVRRVDVGGGDDLPFGSFIATAKTGAQDSVMIDMTTLAGLGATAPAVGTQINLLQGILNQRVTVVSTYRIQIRDANDIVIASPPKLANAYPIEDNILRVLFDRNVTQASAEDENNYSLTSLGSVDLAQQISGQEVRLTITNGLSDGDLEGLTVVGLISSATSDTMQTPESDTFVNGVIEPSVIQTPDPVGLSASPCEDRSRYAGAGSSIGSLTVSFRGVGTAQYGSLYYVQGLSGGPRNGISIFGPTTPLTPGRKFLIVGNVQEFGSGFANGRETEVVSTVYIVDEGAQAVPSPVVKSIGVLSDTTCDATQSIDNAEDWEGVLVRVNKAYVTEDRTAGQSFIIAGPGADSILVSNNSLVFTTFAADSGTFVRVTGVLGSNSASSLRWRIQPRNDADIVLVTAGVDGRIPSGITFAVSPNPARTPRITFGLPEAADVDLAVYDLAGRKIAQIEHGTLQAGTYSRQWLGLDSRGKKAGSGVYFYRLQVGDVVRTLRGIKLQ